jgi:hypothetical protein
MPFFTVDHISRFGGASMRCSDFGVAPCCKKFVSVHAQIHNHFNLERHLLRRPDYKQGRAAALAEWRALAP